MQLNYVCNLADVLYTEGYSLRYYNGHNQPLYSVAFLKSTTYK